MKQKTRYCLQYKVEQNDQIQHAKNERQNHFHVIRGAHPSYVLCKHRAKFEKKYSSNTPIKQDGRVTWLRDMASTLVNTTYIQIRQQLLQQNKKQNKQTNYMATFLH